MLKYFVWYNITYVFYNPNNYYSFSKYNCVVPNNFSADDEEKENENIWVLSGCYQQILGSCNVVTGEHGMIDCFVFHKITILPKIIIMIIMIYKIDQGYYVK